MGGFPSFLGWTKEETDLLLDEWPRTVLGFWMREKSKRRESSSDFSPPSNIFFDPSSILERFEAIEGRDQIRSAIKSWLHELALPWRADRFENFMWTICRGRILVWLWEIREDFQIYILSCGDQLPTLRYWVWNLRSGRLDLSLIVVLVQMLVILDSDFYVYKFML